ncbi:unnamed protein product [Schistosoma margrebowiei]|uniref:Uncharacterized protein n=1 Tax=Schistosoma margrebowiei TaxID=48269 RepID=A0AA85A3A1_9TREM|nr:unnamed protein product [Schistosoma margrebowiei]
MIFVTLILIISVQSFDCTLASRKLFNFRLVVLLYLSTGAQTFYCYLACSHNATTQGDFDKCIKKCNDGSGLGEESCMNNCGTVTNHEEVCETVCGGNNGGLFPLCLYNCDQQHPNGYEGGFDDCKTKCYGMNER